MLTRDQACELANELRKRGERVAAWRLRWWPGARVLDARLSIRLHDAGAAPGGFDTPALAHFLHVQAADRARGAAVGLG